jgi:hypothetical protein
LARGLEITGTDATTKSVHGNIETAEGTAFFKQDGLGCLECPMTLTMTCDLSRLQASQRTSLLRV